MSVYLCRYFKSRVTLVSWSVRIWANEREGEELLWCFLRKRFPNEDEGDGGNGRWKLVIVSVFRTKSRSTSHGSFSSHNKRRLGKRQNDGLTRKFLPLDHYRIGLILGSHWKVTRMIFLVRRMSRRFLATTRLGKNGVTRDGESK